MSSDVVELTGQTNLGVMFQVMSSSGAASNGGSQDCWMIRQDSGRLRVAVVDGVPGWRSPEQIPGVDAGHYAAATLLSYLQMLLPTSESFSLANVALHNPEVLSPRSQASVAGLAIDVHLSSLNGVPRLSFEGTLAADCDLYAASSPVSTLCYVSGGDWVVPQLRQEWTEWLRRNPDLSLDERCEKENNVFSHPDSQTVSSVGRYEKSRFRSFYGSARHLVLATDGALLREAALLDVTVRTLPDWFASLGKRSDATIVVVSAPD